jgi:hypothetical protein
LPGDPSHGARPLLDPGYFRLTFRTLADSVPAVGRISVAVAGEALGWSAAPGSCSSPGQGFPACPPYRCFPKFLFHYSISMASWIARVVFYHGVAFDRLPDLRVGVTSTILPARSNAFSAMMAIAFPGGAGSHVLRKERPKARKRKRRRLRRVSGEGRFEGLKGIAKQHGDGHGPTPPGTGGDGRAEANPAGP